MSTMTLEQLAYEISEEALSHTGAVARRLMDVAGKIREMAQLTSREAKGDDVAWQVRTPLARNSEWEACTQDAYYATRSTGRYLGMPHGTTDVETRPLYSHPAAQEAARAMGEVLEDVIKAAAIDCARRAYGYWRGDSTGGSSAMSYFDNNRGLGGIAYTIEMMEGCIRDALKKSSKDYVLVPLKPTVKALDILAWHLDEAQRGPPFYLDQIYDSMIAATQDGGE